MTRKKVGKTRSRVPDSKPEVLGPQDPMWKLGTAQLAQKTFPLSMTGILPWRNSTDGGNLAEKASYRCTVTATFLQSNGCGAGRGAGQGR
jgi:hypothetical protein